MRAYVYLVLTSPVQARSTIVGNSVFAEDSQQIVMGTFYALINKDYSIGVDIERYQGILKRAVLKVDFSTNTGIYMLPNNLTLDIEKITGYNYRILISTINMKIVSKRNINKAEVYHQKSNQS